jgi:putative ABC transport system permease protein
MFRNYFLSTFRFFLRNKGFALINVTGLALGIACSVLIFLYVNDELNFDRYHEKANSTYMVCVDSKYEHGEYKSGWTTPPMLPVMLETYPEIETGTRLCLWYSEYIFAYKEKTFAEKYVVGADSTVFDVFSIPFIYGNPKTALNKPNVIVLTESTAKKYFGDRNPVGEVLELVDRRDYEITGVVKDQPRNSHFYFDILFSLVTHPMATVTDEGWFNHTYSSYIVLQESYNPKDLEAKFDSFVRDNIGPAMLEGSGVTIDWYEEQGYWYKFWLLPLKDVHLSQMIDEEHNTKSFIYILGLIGLFIMLIACVNYMNMATAMSINRSHEVGIRKVVGAFRRQLITHYLGESVLLCFIALCLGMLLIELVIPYYNEFAGKELKLNYFSHPFIIPGLLVFAIILGIISGLYPSDVLSSYNPVAVLKGWLIRQGRTGTTWLRNVLVVFQFTICIVIIIGTFIVFKQLHYTQSQYLGFDKEQILVVNRAYGLKDKQKLFKQELLKHPAIKNITFGLNMPGRHHNKQGHHIKGEPDHKNPAIFVAWGDYDYIKTLGFEIVEGRDFNKEMPTDSFTAIINEETARFYELDDPLSTVFDYSPEPAVDSINYQIIGVVKDFHFYSLHNNIEPWILYPLRQSIWDYADYAIIKFGTEDIHSVVKLVEDHWKKFAVNYPFEFTFLDEDFKHQYDKDIKAKRMFSVFSVFAIIIACLGLLGLTSFTIRQRTREIGIRKAMGSTGPEILLLLSRQFSKWVLISNVIAWPVAYYFMHKWLNNFAYRINMPWLLYVLAGLMALILALLTVSYHSWSASRKNPADALRYE